MTRLGILVALALAVPLWARAGSFEVNPVGLTLSGTRSTGVVTVTNASDSLTVVQLELMSKPDAKLETAYRLFLQEVPPPNESGVQGLQVLLRVGIPVFVEPAGDAAPEVHWSARRL